MPKFFVASDLHGFYNEYIKALDEAGYDETNEDHWLIVCGDYFDRGKQPKEIMNFLMNAPRAILVRGNHEGLLEQALSRGYPEPWDKENGTWKTIRYLDPSGEYGIKTHQVRARIRPFFEKMVPYFETKNHIFVHSWVPVICHDHYPDHYIHNREFEFTPDWREAHPKDWERAMWGCPFVYIKHNMMPDKTIVFGHWHCSVGWALAEGRSQFGEDAKFDPYYGEGYIAIDGCTAHTRKVNVIVIEDEFIKEED